MKTVLSIVLVGLVLMTGCSKLHLFNGYNKEEFPITRVSESTTKTVQVMNNSNSVQHVIDMSFYGASNKTGHFQVLDAKIGDKKVPIEDIFIPAQQALTLEVAYAPLNLVSDDASYHGWKTTEEDRMPAVTEADISGDALSTMAAVAGGEFDITGYEPAIHRAVLVIVYDKPDQGYMNIEFVGGAVPGPKGEETATPMGGGGGDCAAGGTVACFIGKFSIDLPGLMSSGPMEVGMSGPIEFKIENGVAELDGNKFPPILIALKGNGPGEPLEGKPVDAISIVISGAPDTLASGTFDGKNLSFNEVTFRIRVILGAITIQDVNPGLQATVDFTVPGLAITTSEPFDANKIVFGADTMLSSSPSGNSLFDTFLGGARIVVKFTGTLELP